MNQQNPFKWRHFEAEIILLCVRWYLRYSLSYRDLEELMRERGLQADHTTIYRWVQHYAPELEKRCRPHLKATNDSWRVDETYIKIKGTWTYLYRAVDSDGDTLEFLLSPTRDAEAAKCFFVKALHSPAGSTSHVHPIEEQVEEPTVADPNTTPLAPRVINVDKNAAYPRAIADLKAIGALPRAVELRQVKYLNNIVEQDHRFIKRRVDETGSHIAMTPLYAYAPRGKRAVGRAPRNYGASMTLMASLSLSGIGAAFLLDGAADATAFEVYVEQLLAPSLRTGQIVILDNLSIHLGPRVRAAIQARGCRLLFLPAYSPDFSPIEEAFSKLKTFLRRVGARTREALQEAIAQALDLITATDALGWFTHCDYLPPAFDEKAQQV